MATDGVLLAVIAGSQLLLLTIVQGILAGRKDRRDALLLENKNRVDAELKQKEKDEGYARQDRAAEHVAQKVALSAKLALQAAKQAADATQKVSRGQEEAVVRRAEVARLSAESREKVQAQLLTLDEQGKRIHVLMNSDMTAARTNERDQTKLTLLALQRVQALSASLGLPINEEETGAIEAAEHRIRELDLILADLVLADRHAAQLAAEAEDKRKNG